MSKKLRVKKLRQEELRKSGLPPTAAAVASINDRIGQELAVLLHPVALGTRMAKAGLAGGTSSATAVGMNDAGRPGSAPQPTAARQPGVAPNAQAGAGSGDPGTGCNKTPWAVGIATGDVDPLESSYLAQQASFANAFAAHPVMTYAVPGGTSASATAKRRVQTRASKVVAVADEWVPRTRTRCRPIVGTTTRSRRAFPRVRAAAPRRTRPCERSRPVAWPRPRLTITGCSPR